MIRISGNIEGSPDSGFTGLDIYQDQNGVVNIVNETEHELATNEGNLLSVEMATSTIDGISTSQIILEPASFCAAVGITHNDASIKSFIKSICWKIINNYRAISI